MGLKIRDEMTALRNWSDILILLASILVNHEKQISTIMPIAGTIHWFFHSKMLVGRTFHSGL